LPEAVVVAVVTGAVVAAEVVVGAAVVAWVVVVAVELQPAMKVPTMSTRARTTISDLFINYSPPILSFNCHKTLFELT
jgi:hypothetical protein